MVAALTNAFSISISSPDQLFPYFSSMLLVLFYFFICATLSYGMGMWFSRVLKFRNCDIVQTLFLGLVAIQVLSAIWSFFAGLSMVWSCFLSLFSVMGYVVFWKDVLCGVKILGRQLSRKRNSTTLFFTMVIAVAFISSGPSYFIDNESYYIQTISWLDQYGLVKGVSNVHLFLSQHSGFHILQSALNFNYFYDRFNDLSGLYLLLGFAWSLKSDPADSTLLRNYRKLYPVLFILGILFASAPSPDLPVYVLSYIVVYYFLTLWEELK